MSQIYDETLVLVRFNFKEEKNKEISQKIVNFPPHEKLNPRYFEGIISIGKVKNKVYSSINLNYNLFRVY